MCHGSMLKANIILLVYIPTVATKFINNITILSSHTKKKKGK